MTDAKEKKLEKLDLNDWEELVDRIDVFPTRAENEAYLRDFIRVRSRS